MQKRDWQNIEKSQSYVEKSDFDPPSWIDPLFLANLPKYNFESRCWLRYQLISKDRTQNTWQILQ
jgi:hypothetical protein